MHGARGVGDLGQNGTRARKQSGAGRQKAYPARGPLEQLHAEFVLERAHLAAQRRL
jgi:hypothetical protein